MVLFQLTMTHLETENQKITPGNSGVFHSLAQFFNPFTFLCWCWNTHTLICSHSFLFDIIVLHVTSPAPRQSICPQPCCPRPRATLEFQTRSGWKNMGPVFGSPVTNDDRVPARALRSADYIGGREISAQESLSTHPPLLEEVSCNHVSQAHSGRSPPIALLKINFLAL